MGGFDRRIYEIERRLQTLEVGADRVDNRTQEDKQRWLTIPPKGRFFPAAPPPPPPGVATACCEGNTPFTLYLNAPGFLPNRTMTYGIPISGVWNVGYGGFNEYATGSYHTVWCYYDEPNDVHYWRVHHKYRWLVGGSTYQNVDVYAAPTSASCNPLSLSYSILRRTNGGGYAFYDFTVTANPI